MTSTPEEWFSWEAPTEHGEHWIEISLDHPVNPWEHEGAGSITWGAHLDRMAPLGEEAASIIREAWQQRRENIRETAERQRQESEPVNRAPSTDAGVKPGWAERIDHDEYWIHLTLYQPVNQRWVEQKGPNWSRGERINDGILQRGVTVEATSHLGCRALQVVEALHSAHPYGRLDQPASDRWYD